MAGLIRRIARGHILPRRPGAQDPQDAIQDIARIAPRPAAAIAPQTRRGQQGCENGPLIVGEVHAAGYDGDPTRVSVTSPHL